MAFSTQFFSEQLQGFDASSLDLLQRILLVNDGTLTEALEAAFLEPVLLVKLAGGVSRASERNEELELDAGEQLMERKILLRGEASGANFVYAESLLAVDRLPGPLREGLLNSSMPLGRLWSEHRLETWKEIRHVERRRAGAFASYFGCREDDEVLARRYRVFSGGRPSMVIAEYFPAKYHRTGL